MLHSSSSYLLLAFPFVCSVWAAASSGLGRKQEESSGSEDGVAPPLPEAERALGRVQAQVGTLNERLANLDAKLQLLAESNQHLVNSLRSCTAQLCLSQAEIGNSKDELALARARLNQLEELRLAQQQEIERGAARLRAVEAELASRTRAAESASERLSETERAVPARIMELDGRLLAGQRELAQGAEQLALARQRCEDLEEELARLDEEFRLQLEAQREAEDRAGDRERSQTVLIGELEGHLALRDEELSQVTAVLEGLRSEFSEGAALGSERSRRCAELEEELRLQVEEQRQIEARARELERELSTRIAELEARAGRRDEELRERAAALEVLGVELAGESERSVERSRRCAELETGLRQRAEELQAGERRVRELEAQLALRERELHERSAATEALRGELARGSAESEARGARCDELGGQLAAREEESRALQVECAALSARCQDLSRTLEVRDADLNENEQRLARARGRIGVLEAEGARRAGLHAAELLVVDELATAHLGAVLHGHAGQAARALPPAYIKGLEQHDLVRALCGLLGGPAPLSSDSMLQLGEHWQRQHAAWNSEPIEGEVVYLWADAPFVKVGLEPEGAALLVVVAGMIDGSRRVVSVESGPRDSAEVWFACLERLARRGMNLPRLVVGDDGLGLWPALERAGWDCARQRCWDPRIEHVVEALPKRQQRKAGELLRAVAKAETRAEANARKAAWVKRYRARRPEAVARIESDWDQMLSLYSFPAEHWPHLRTTAIVETLLSSLRLYTKLSKPHPPTPNAQALLWKLLQIGASGLRKLNCPELLPAVAARESCADGILGAKPRGRAA